MRLLFAALACLTSFTSFTSFGQGWEQTYQEFDSSVGFSVQQTTDGGYVLSARTGTTGAGWMSNAWLIKTDSNGTEQWSQTYGGGKGGNSAIGSTFAQQTSDGGYIIGHTVEVTELVNYDFTLRKIDQNGVEQWSKTFGGAHKDYFISVQQTTDGGYILAGQTSYYSSTDLWLDNFFWLIKINENGIEQWSQTFPCFGSSDEDGLYGGNPRNVVQQTTDEGYIIIFNSGTTVLLKTDSNGTEQWSQSIIGSPTLGLSFGKSVQQTADGGYIITGHQTSFESGQNSGFLIKTNPSGTEQWAHNFDSAFISWGESVQQTADGGYIVAGEMNNDDFDEFHKIYLLKIDENGEEQWAQTFGGTEANAAGLSVQQTADGGYIITGYKDIIQGPTKVWLIKTDSEGTLSSEFTIPTPSSRKLDKVVDALGREVNYTPNQILFHIYDDGSVEKKFVVE